MVDYVTLTIGGPIDGPTLTALASELDKARFGDGCEALAAAIADGRPLVLDGEAHEGDFAAVEAFCKARGVMFTRARRSSSAVLDAAGFDEYECLDEDGEVVIDFKTFREACDHSARAVFALRDRLARHAAEAPPLTLMAIVPE